MPIIKPHGNVKGSLTVDTPEINGLTLLIVEDEKYNPSSFTLDKEGAIALRDWLNLKYPE